jgi:1,4-dihydroxy-2-naphthoyl-CoA synthase
VPDLLSLQEKGKFSFVGLKDARDIFFLCVSESANEEEKQCRRCDARPVRNEDIHAIPQR